jgi:hypothetical protein
MLALGQYWHRSPMGGDSSAGRSQLEIAGYA